jgi:hypothetical protein
MKTYTVEVISTVEVTLDETKFTPEFFAEFNETISDWDDDLEEHAKHLAWVHATGVENLSYVRIAPFVEGYGPVDEMGISAKTEGTECEVISP